LSQPTRSAEFSETLTDDSVQELSPGGCRGFRAADLINELISEWAAGLAGEHGLNCFDPQWTRLRTDMREGWRFELQSERGQRLRDPDQDSVRRVISKLSRNNYYVVLERADGWYVQVGLGERASTRAGWYALERRDGSPDRHYRIELSDVEAVCQAFIAFIEDDESLSTRFAWRPHRV